MDRFNNLIRKSYHFCLIWLFLTVRVLIFFVYMFLSWSSLPSTIFFYAHLLQVWIFASSSVFTIILTKLSLTIIICSSIIIIRCISSLWRSLFGSNSPKMRSTCVYSSHFWSFCLLIRFLLCPLSFVSIVTLLFHSIWFYSSPSRFLSRSTCYVICTSGVFTFTLFFIPIVLTLVSLFLNLVLKFWFTVFILFWFTNFSDVVSTQFEGTLPSLCLHLPLDYLGWRHKYTHTPVAFRLIPNGCQT